MNLLKKSKMIDFLGMRGLVWKSGSALPQGQRLPNWQERWSYLRKPIGLNLCVIWMKYLEAVLSQ